MAEQDKPQVVVDGVAVEKKSKKRFFKKSDSPNPEAQRPRSKWPIIVIVIILLAAIGGLAFWQKHKKDLENAKKPQIVCNNDILNRGAQAFDKNTAVAFEPVANDIQRLKNYDKDSSCLLIVANYYVQISDYDNANNTLNKIKTIDPTGKNINVGKYNVGKPALENLSQQIKSLGELNKNIDSHVIPSPEIEQ